jgi:hypothetical protein
MRYFRKRRAGIQDKGTTVQPRRGGEANDPLSGVANLFDLGLVFIVGLIFTLFSAYHLQDLFSEHSELTIMKKSAQGEMEIITKKGTTIEARKVTEKTAQGRGERLGTAYRLEDGTMIYVPDEQ